MEDKSIIGEQPQGESVHAVETEVVNGTSKPDGSPLGKFRDADSLLGAYNELQSEFTRKCQKLSEAEKKLQGYASMSTTEEAGKETGSEFVWNKNIKEFLQSHNKAHLLSKEITDEVMSDVDKYKSEDGLEKAYWNVLERKYKTDQELSQDDDFVNNYILNNEKIKNKIIKDYVCSLQQTQSPITIGSSGNDSGVVSSNNFSNLDDARKYVESMFKS